MFYKYCDSIVFICICIIILNTIRDAVQGTQSFKDVPCRVPLYNDNCRVPSWFIFSLKFRPGWKIHISRIVEVKEGSKFLSTL